MQIVKERKPALLVGGIANAARSKFEMKNNKNLTVVEANEIKRQNACHLKNMMALYDLQESEGRHYVHEHPTRAASWNQAEMKNVTGRNTSICNYQRKYLDRDSE